MYRIYPRPRYKYHEKWPKYVSGKSPFFVSKYLVGRGMLWGSDVLQKFSVKFPDQRANHSIHLFTDMGCPGLKFYLCSCF